MEEFRCLIPEALLDGLGLLIPGEKSIISPLNSNEVKAYNPEQINVLQSLKILDTAGKVTNFARPALQVLGEAKAFTKVHLNGGGQSFQYVHYFASNGEASVALIPMEEGLEIQYPANVSQILQGLKEYTGDSVLRSCDFQVELPLKEGVAFCALVDLRRKSSLYSLINGLELLPQGYDASQIADAIAHIPESPQWLTPIVKMLGEVEAPLLTTEVQEILRSLAQRGLVSQTNNLFTLQEPAEEVADRLLIFDNFITLNAGREEQDDFVSSISFTCLQAGVNDLLYLEVYSGKILLNFISASMLYGYLHHFLTNADALKNMPREDLPNKATNLSQKNNPQMIHCQACHHPLEVGARFCPNCGAPVIEKATPQPAICPQCGHTSNPGAKFCGNCGLVLPVNF